MIMMLLQGESVNKRMKVRVDVIRPISLSDRKRQKEKWGLRNAVSWLRCRVGYATRRLGGVAWWAELTGRRIHADPRAELVLFKGTGRVCRVGYATRWLSDIAL